MEFTSEQKQAVTQRGKALLVSAGAGSGKTRVPETGCPLLS